MAFEIFDDVAFYWFLQVLLGVAIIPLTIYRIFAWLTKKKVHKTRSHPHVKNIPDYIPSQTLVIEKNETIESKLSLSNIFFLALWVLFLLLMIQLPKWHNRSMTDFEPYAILGISKGASASDIKRAHRKMSLLYHPDRCQEESRKVCEDKFILITKAYQALTDEATRENYEKYGNPDGYQGTSVTIGLPKWLTNKDNELVILSAYFAGLIILVTTVGGWWAHSSKFHKSGVYKQSIDIYWRFIKQNMRMRHLLDVLSASAEFKMLDHKIPSDTSNPKFKQLQMLEDQIIAFLKKRAPKGQTPKLDTLFKASYVRRSNALLHAHLIGIPIPNELKEDYLFVCQESPRLIDVMIDMTLQRERFWAQGLQLIQLKQSIIQGVWPFESNLKQLPYWTEGVDKSLQKKKLRSITDLNFLKKDNLRDTLSQAYKNYSSDYSHLISGTNTGDDKNNNENNSNNNGELPAHIKNEIQQKQQKNKENESNKKKDEIEYAPGTLEESDQDVEQMVNDGEAMVRMYPVVHMNWCARTYDEKNVCVGDIVKVTVHLTRLKEPWKFTVESFKDTEEMEPPELKARKAKNKKGGGATDDDKNKTSEKETTTSGSDDDDGENEFDSESIDFEAQDYDDMDGLGFVENDLDETRRLQIARLHAPVVHVNRFPFRVKEKWMVLLVDHAVPAVIDQRAVPALVGTKKIDLHFRINRPPGQYKYLLFARCDSYLGCDRHVEFTLDVKAPENVRNKSDENDGESEKSPELDYQIPDEEEYEAEPKWYYLWNSTFWEFLLTLFLLYFIYLVLVSTSFGKNWIQPYVEMFFDYCIYPITSVTNEKLTIVLFNPLCQQILQLTGFDLKQWWFDTPIQGGDDDDFDYDYDDYDSSKHSEM